MTVTREWLRQQIAEMEAARDDIPFGLNENGTKTLEALKMLLAGMDSVPVAWTDEQELRDLEKSGCAYLFTVKPITPNADPRRVIRLYTAPPAPLAVPGEISTTDAMRIMNGRVITMSVHTAYKNGWNAYRAAMLKAGPVTAGTVPDGWKLVPVEPTKEMIDAGWSYYMTTKSPSSLGVYGAMLAAAPEQEV